MSFITSLYSGGVSIVGGVGGGGCSESYSGGSSKLAPGFVTP